MAVGLVALALALGLGYGVLTGAPAPTPPAPRTPSAPQAVGGASEPRTVQGTVSRDLLRYAEEAPPPAASERLEPLGPIVTLPAPPSVPAERLIGFVRSAGRLQAALALPGGETAVLAAGESASGYTLVAMEEETRVVLRLPDGRELTLTVPD
jgi:hypothetical protein